jgi:porphyrinogen peroxidase
LVDAKGRDQMRRELAIWPRSQAPSLRRSWARPIEDGVDVAAGDTLGRRVTSLGDIPLAVLTAGTHHADSTGMPRRLARALYRLWLTMQDELAALSSDHVHVVALRSDHWIQIGHFTRGNTEIDGRPDVVVRAVRAVVRAARDRARLPPSGACSPGPPFAAGARRPAWICADRAWQYADAVQNGESQAILGPLTEAAIFLVLTVNPGEEEAVRDVLADVGGLKRSVGFRIPEGELSCVVGIGSQLWDRLFGRPRPAGLHPFPGFAGARHTAVATDGDLLFHLRAHRLDLCFELAQRLMERLAGHARVIDEVHGFRSFDDRDLLGFVDGTENPEGADAVTAVVVSEEDPRFAGGSYVVVQKYLHDLAAWDALAIEDQERAMGRTKLSDLELPDDVKPANSHVALTTIVDDDGEEHQIMRFNMPFGTVGAGEFGTYFIGYARSPDVIEQMLTNMFIGKPPGNYDRILDFSTAVTGNLFFVPTIDLLEDPPTSEAEEAPAAAPETGDASLGIGGLREG